MRGCLYPAATVVALLLSASSALDVQVVTTTCDSTLPLTASLYLQCSDGGARCTFGDLSTVYGEFYYNGVENSGIQNNYGYLSADLSLFGMDFNLCTMQQVPLCDDTMVADDYNENDCPGDGTFAYSIQYQLPSSGPEAASWLATGWKGSGLVQMYAEQDESMKIGECVLQLQTFVTQQGGSNTLVGAPSAAIATGIAVGVVALLSLLCCYCYCCRSCCGRRRNKKGDAATKADEDSYFKRLEEDKSYWSGSKAASKKSGRTKKTEITTAEQASVISDL